MITQKEDTILQNYYLLPFIMVLDQCFFLGFSLINSKLFFAPMTGVLTISARSSVLVKILETRSI